MNIREFNVDTVFTLWHTEVVTTEFLLQQLPELAPESFQLEEALEHIVYMDSEMSPMSCLDDE